MYNGWNYHLYKSSSNGLLTILYILKMGSCFVKHLSHGIWQIYRNKEDMYVIHNEFNKQIILSSQVSEQKKLIIISDVIYDAIALYF